MIKAALSPQASATNTAGGTTTGSAIDLTTAFGATIRGKCTNGVPGPTVGCTFRVEISNDNSDWWTFSSEIAPTTSSLVYYYQPVVLPPEIMYVRTVFSGNTGQSVIVESDGEKIVSLS